jgi:hypothetical protein
MKILQNALASSFRDCQDLKPKCKLKTVCHVYLYRLWNSQDCHNWPIITFHLPLWNDIEVKNTQCLLALSSRLLTITHFLLTVTIYSLTLLLCLLVQSLCMLALSSRLWNKGTQLLGNGLGKSGIFRENYERAPPGIKMWCANLQFTLYGDLFI